MIRGYENSVIIFDDKRKVFEYLDDPMKLSGHMNKDSFMMAGSKMVTKIDSGQGREVGSFIEMSGKMMGFNIYLKEEIIERKLNDKKTWKTVGAQKLIILERYRMGFYLDQVELGTKVTIFIVYILPKGKKKILGLLFGNWYAKWCVDQMLKDLARHFGNSGQ
jgi:hypothetical protein